MARLRSFATRFGALALMAGVQLGCSRAPAEGEWYSHWDLDGGCNSSLPAPGRHNAHGDPADFCQAAGEGRWVWVVYGAPWCSSSLNQAARLRSFEQAAGQRLTLFTVLTSGSEPLTLPRLADARAWSGSSAVPFERVLFDPLESDTRTVPQHLLIGPDGRTWWRWAGPLDTATMLERFDAFASARLPAQARALPPLNR
ncbi:MAG TPA: hypothetical protein PKC60_11920 [Hydrogenophaga sp.]|uniref:TlpA family protein disulfide reductase n=1 Tax=Hydrogenophaga sp. TaxID=1904254 RepID=UPI002BFE756A|nr:hypothetical protein [Hydrogenophaga sp.]HMN93925.1 hypothetical protein [Hydrogenophaga sp.]HMP12041.1 hypothetical protein [Hydrogenophaga sp.]